MANFSDAVDGVRDAWNFFWPAILECIVIILTIYEIFPTYLVMASESLPHVETVRNSIEKLTAFLGPFSLSGLIPIGTAVLFLTALYLIKQVSMHIHNLMPPSISFLPYDFIAPHLNERQLRVLIRKYPLADSIESAYQSLLRDAERATLFPRRSTSVSIWAERLAKLAVAVSLATLCSAWLIWGATLDLFERFLGTSLTATVLWLLSLVNGIYELEQALFKENFAAMSILEKDAIALLAVSATNEENLMITKHQSDISLGGKANWWRLGLNLFRYQWFYRNFVRPSVTFMLHRFKKYEAD